jgi:hypothetical protein
MMKMAKDHIKLHSILRKSGKLMEVVVEIEDRFLQYLLGMIILYVEEQVGARHELLREAPFSDDPDIVEMAKALKGFTTSKK